MCKIKDFLIIKSFLHGSINLCAYPYEFVEASLDVGKILVIKRCFFGKLFKEESIPWESLDWSDEKALYSFLFDLEGCDEFGDFFVSLLERGEKFDGIIVLL